MSRGKPTRRATRVAAAQQERAAAARARAAGAETSGAAETPVSRSSGTRPVSNRGRSTVLAAEEGPDHDAVATTGGTGDRRLLLRGREASVGSPAVAAVVVLLVQLVWRTYYLAKGYFTQDDFLMLHKGGTSALTPSYLMQNYSGHLFPGGFVFAYAEARIAPLSWPAAYIPVLLMQLAAGVLMWMVLSRLLGSRWERIPILTIFCLSPMSLWSTQWWAVAIQFLPLELCALGAALGYLRWRQDGSRWGWRLTPVFVVAALLFEERGILVPITIAALAVILPRGESLKSRFIGALRRDRMLWLILSAIVAAYLLLHAWLAPVRATGGGGTNDSLDLVTNFFFRNLVPAIVGGPWTGAVFIGSALVPPGWVIVVSCAVVAVTVVYTVRFGGGAAGAAWLMLLAYALVDGLLVFAGRAQYGSLSGLTPRYVADMLPILVITFAGAVRDVAAPPRVSQFFARRGRVDRRVAASIGVAVLYTASAAVTTHLTAPDLYNTAARTYVDNLRHDLATQPAVSLFDSTVPEDVMVSWFGNDDRVSTVYGIAPGAPGFDAPSEQLRIVGPDGHVHPIELANPVTAVKGPSKACGYNVTLNTTLVFMSAHVPLNKNVIQLGYYTNVDDTAVLTAGTETVRFPVHPGLHVVDVVVEAEFDNFTIRLSRTAGTMCLVSVKAGVPQPATP